MTTFLCGSKLTTALLEKIVSQSAWLFVSLLCSLERKNCKERNWGKKDWLPLPLFFFEGCLLKNNNPNQAIIGIYIKHFQVLKWEQSTRPLRAELLFFSLYQQINWVTEQWGNFSDLSCIRWKESMNSRFWIPGNHFDHAFIGSQQPKS